MLSWLTVTKVICISMAAAIVNVATDFLVITLTKHTNVPWLHFLQWLPMFNYCYGYANVREVPHSVDIF